MDDTSPLENLPENAPENAKPADPWALPPAALPTDTQPLVPPTFPLTEPVTGPQPTQPVSPPQAEYQPTQPYGDPYAAGYGATWGASAPVAAVPPVSDPWLPPGGSGLPPQDVVSSGGPGSSGPGRGRRPGLMLVAVAVAAGLIGAAGAGAVEIATRPGTDSSSNAGFTATTPSGSTSNVSIDHSRPAGTVAAVANDVLPSVVSILETNGSQAGEGSGIILDTAGHILTNNHVVADVASGGTLTVTFKDGSSSKATIVGRDPLTDIAVIKVEGKTGLVPAKLGSSASLQVGDQVIAIGSPLGLSGTVTEGIVSALNRPVVTAQDTNEDAAISAIQTDAAINPGNSGGALVDADGAVVGVNSAIATVAGQSLSGGQAGNIGVGFAIPIDQAKRIASDIIAGRKIAHALLGTTVSRNTSELTTIGAKLRSIKPGSAAATAGLKVGDDVTKINGEVIQGGDGLIATLRSFAPGTTVQLTYVRAGITRTISVTLGSDATP